MFGFLKISDLQGFDWRFFLYNHVFKWAIIIDKVDINLSKFSSFNIYVRTSPAKKQMCLRSMCLPNDICSSVRRMCSVSTMSLSHASGWFRLALSLLGILDLIPWNRCNICVCSFWNVELRMALHTRSICLETWDKVNQLIVVHWVEQGSSLPILRSLKEPGSIAEPLILWSLPWDLFISPNKHSPNSSHESEAARFVK